jgi:hypothetical protein
MDTPGTPVTNNPGTITPGTNNSGAPVTNTPGAPDTSNSVNPGNTVQNTGNANAHSNQATSEDVNNLLSTIALVGTPLMFIIS